MLYQRIELGTIPYARKTNGEIDWARGILQAIGYKELLPLLLNESHQSPISLHSCHLEFQNATRRYCRRQISWIQRKLGPKCTLSHEPVVMDDNRFVRFYALSTNRVKEIEWADFVLNPAVAITRNFIDKDPEPLVQPDMENQELMNALEYIKERKEEVGNVTWKPIHCDLCRKTVHGDHEWRIHLKSKQHKNMSRIRASAQWEFYQRARQDKNRT